MSTNAESIFATVAAEMEPVDGFGLTKLGMFPVPFEFPGSTVDPLEGLEADVVVSAHAVPPPAPTHAIAKTASAVRRSPELPLGRWGVEGQVGGPHWGSNDHGLYEAPTGSPGGGGGGLGGR
jgi:hypothetical protein